MSGFDVKGDVVEKQGAILLGGQGVQPKRGPWFDAGIASA